MHKVRGIFWSIEWRKSSWTGVESCWTGLRQVALSLSSSAMRGFFWLIGTFCRCNGHCIVSSSKEVHHTMTTKYPAGIMAICVVSSYSNVSNRLFAERTKFNATVHCKVMYYKFTHWMKDKAAGGSCVIQQDYNPAHMTNNTQLSQGVRSAILGKGFVALQFTWP